MQCPKILSELSTTEFEKVLDNYINELILEKGKSFMNLIPNLKSYSEILKIKNFMQAFFERIVETNCNKSTDLDKLFEYEKISLETEKSKIMKSKILENIDIVKRRIIEKYITMSEYYLVDFNWNVNISVSSNHLAKIQVPFLLVELILKKFGIDKELRVMIEMNKEELNNFIQILHKMEQQIEL